MLKEIGGLLERTKYGRFGKFLGDVALDQQMRGPVIAVQNYPVTVILFVDLEGSMVMHAWEYPATQQGIEPGRSITARYENTFLGFAFLVPLHGDPVSGVFGGDAQERWQDPWPDVLETDQADSSHACAVDQLGPEWCREKPSQNMRVHPEIDQDSAVDDAT